MTAGNGKQRTLFQTIALVLVMGALAWASVPFYDWFCRVTGTLLNCLSSSKTMHHRRLLTTCVTSTATTATTLL